MVSVNPEEREIPSVSRTEIRERVRKKVAKAGAWRRNMRAEASNEGPFAMYVRMLDKLRRDCSIFTILQYFAKYIVKPRDENTEPRYTTEIRMFVLLRRGA